MKMLITAIDPLAGASLTGCQPSSCCGMPLFLLTLCPAGENSFRDSGAVCIQTHRFFCDVRLYLLTKSKCQTGPSGNLPDSGGTLI